MEPATDPAPRRAFDALAAARDGLAAGPSLARGLLRVGGTRRLSFLHRMSTQKLAELAPGAAAYAAFLDGKAKVVAEGMVVAGPDDVLLDVDPSAAAPLAAHLARYVLREDVRIEDASAELRVVPVLGPRAADVVRALGAGLRAWPNPRRGAPAWDVAVAAGAADALRAALAAVGAAELGDRELEALRVAAGVPRWGAEVDAGRLVMEAALTGPAVSFDKGCYLGQEVVLRGTFRGQVQRGLVQLALPPGAAPGARLRAGDADVGVVTSAADTPDGRLGLGYVRRAQWEPGTRLATDGGEAVVRRALVEEKD